MRRRSAQLRRELISTLSGRLLLLVLLAIVPTVGLVLFTVARERERAAAAARRSAAQVVALAAREHGQLVDAAQVLLAALSKAPEVVGAGPGCAETLRELGPTLRTYVNVGVVSADGALLCSAHPAARPAALAGAEWLARARRAGAAVGEYDVGSVTGGSAFVVALPAATARPGGVVLFAAVDLGWFNTLAARVPFPEGAALTVTDDEGRILARFPDPERWVGRTVADAPVVRATRGSGTGESSGLDGVRRLYAYAPLRAGAESRAQLRYGIPTDVAYAGADRDAARNLALLGLVAALALGIASFMGRALITRRTDALVRAADRLRAGDFATRTGLPHSADELGAVAAAFDTMAAALQLERAERERAERDIRESQAQLRRLARRAETGREQERARISREIHDELGGSLTAMKMDVAWIRGRLPADAVPLRERAAVVVELIDHAIDAVRRLATELRPGILDDLGLAAAIEWQAEEVAKRADLDARVDIRTDLSLVSPAAATAVFRILQEALTNVVRHAGARRVEIRALTAGPDLVLEVQDDGRGMQPEATPGRKSLGLLGMRERARAFGGRVSVRGAGGAGTLVRLTLPLRSIVRRPGQGRDGADDGAATVTPAAPAAAGTPGATPAPADGNLAGGG